MPAPYKYLTKYKSLSVTVPGPICGEPLEVDVMVGVGLYANTGSSGTKRQNVAGLDDGSKDMVCRFLSAYEREKSTPPFSPSKLPTGFSWDNINNVYSGKGSPEDIVGALLLYACYEEKKSGLQTRRRWASPAVLEAGLKQHSVGLQPNFGRIGLDCLGFAVNFVKQDRSMPWPASQIGLKDMEHFTGSVKGARKLRATLDNLQQKDVLVYLQKFDLEQQARHIAVVDTVISKDSTSAKVQIAESYGGVGPQTTAVTLKVFPGELGKYGTAFLLNRGGTVGMDDPKVYVVPAELAAV